MLELAILGLLKEGPLHGYDLRKRLRENFGALANVSFGSLYPALARLEASGAVRTVTAGAAADTPTLPFTGSLGGERAALMARRATAKAAAALGGRGTRARKVYEITPEGERLFEGLLDEPVIRDGDPGGFSLRLAFARHLSPAARVRLLERRHLQLAERLERTNRKLEAPDRLLDPYERSIAEHGRDTVEADLAWIDRLLAAERSGLAEAAARVEREAPTKQQRRREPAGTGSARAQEGRTA